MVSLTFHGVGRAQNPKGLANRQNMHFNAQLGKSKIMHL
jgi:hypothetical protein